MTSSIFGKSFHFPFPYFVLNFIFVTLNRLPYTEAMIREVMRIKPIIPLGVAHRATEDAYLCGYFVPKVS